MCEVVYMVDINGANQSSSYRDIRVETGDLTVTVTTYLCAAHLSWLLTHNYVCFDNIINIADEHC